ncbi:Hypothetical protein CINCED_3A001965 [Cinara cedri]|uniref:Reverse transcriptase domain n=1 Tax=Cinara cedri TaxID=506608 RepID=A0A5E4NCV2_9HEMI|nr:Hypothetical protein CINCED_3A001965 [Cinara cedri]
MSTKLSDLESCINDLKNSLGILSCDLSKVKQANESFSSEIHIFPKAWKVSFVTPVWKSDDRSSVTNYRPNSKLNILKLFDKILKPKLMGLFTHVLVNEQHGFHRAKSTLTNTLVFYSYLVEIVEFGGQIDAIYTDLHKAFDKEAIQLTINIFIDILKPSLTIVKILLFMLPTYTLYETKADGQVTSSEAVTSGPRILLDCLWLLSQG